MLLVFGISMIKDKIAHSGPYETSTRSALCSRMLLFSSVLFADDEYKNKIILSRKKAGQIGHV